MSTFNHLIIPSEPGVYIFNNSKAEIIYIGKANNLRSRIRSYFTKSKKSQKIQKLVRKIHSIEWIIVSNEVEALLLENKLVKKHKPKYNIDLKDAKTFAYIAITKEKFPRIFTTRKPSSSLYIFGPYTEGYLRRELRRLVINIYKIRTCKKFPKRECLNFHIGLCTAPCIGKVDEKTYQIQVEKARSFLMGDYDDIKEHLNKQMKNASKNAKYERAIELRNQITSINLLTQQQVVDNQRIYDQDVIAFKRLGKKLLVVHMGVRKGVLLGKKEYTLDLDINIEQEFLKRFYYSNPIPQEILLNRSIWIDPDEKNTIEEYFSTIGNKKIRMFIPKEGDELRLIKLAEKNIESNLTDDKILTDLQTSLNLPSLPKIIECFDVSNLGKEYLVAGMVRFTEGVPDKKNYRKFKIKSVKGQNDTASIGEVITRRYKRLMLEKHQFPDLIVVDGGIGQVSAAKISLKNLGLKIPIIGLAKKNEEIYFPDETTPRKFNKNRKMMILLRRIRDSAHKFSIRYSRKRRQMRIREEFKKK
jgi:excinuclease ABC subunit C